MTGRLEGRVALVTGAGQGIGRGVALALAKEGAAVALAGRTFSKCERVAAEVADLGGRALAIACDVSSRAQVDAAVDATVQAFGGIDVLVNNAQSSVQAKLEDTTDEDVELAWRTGAVATLYAMQAALPHLQSQWSWVDRQLRVQHGDRGQRGIRGVCHGEGSHPRALSRCIA